MNRRDRVVLRALQDAQDRGVSLSFREVKDATGMRSLHRIQAAVNALEREGYVTRHRRRHCAVTVLKRIDPPQYFIWNDEEKRLRRLNLRGYFIWDDQQKRLVLRQAPGNFPPSNIKLL